MPVYCERLYAVCWRLISTDCAMKGMAAHTPASCYAPGMVRSIWIGILCTGSFVAAEAPVSIFGKYAKACPSPKPCRPTADSLQLTRKSDDKVGVAIRLIYAAGHSCQIDGVGVWKDNKVAIEAEGLEDNKPCRLEISLQGGTATLRDVGMRCTPVYCGTRGTFQGVTFQKPAARSAAPTKR
jgi:hypothetical protein